MINIAVLGYGTVGSGVVEVIRTNQEIINQNAGEEINIKYVDDLREFPGDPVEKILVHDFDIILNDPEVKIVVEVMGGTKPAYMFVKQALEAGKSVCTSNKELVAKHGPELIAIAKQKNVNFFFEASVGGGIPIIRPLMSSITADKINKVLGILNGTTNYILTQMRDEGWDFDAALKTAQDMGYAERNPEADIEGYDACRKIAILSSLVKHQYVDFEDIYTEGISKITATDIKYATKLGRAIKLLASSEFDGDKTYSMVAPFMIPKSHPLYSVNGVFNAIFVNGNVLGDVMFYGSGAGKLPTASAVVSDVVEAARHIGENVELKYEAESLKLTSTDDAMRRFFVRLEGNKEDRLSEIEKILGGVDVVSLDECDNEFAVVTKNAMPEKEFFDKLDKITGVLGRIRIED